MRAGVWCRVYDWPWEGISALFLRTAYQRGPSVPNFSASLNKEMKICLSKELSYVLNFVTQMLNGHLVFGRDALYFQYSISWSFNQKYLPSFPKFLGFYFFIFFVIKMLLVIHRIFQNMHSESVVIGTLIQSLFENSL